MNEFICCSCVVYLIKIRSCHEWLAFSHHPLLIKEISHTVIRCIYRLYLISIFIKETYFLQEQLLFISCYRLCRNSYISRTLIYITHCPAEYWSACIVIFKHNIHVFIVIREFKIPLFCKLTRTEIEFRFCYFFFTAKIDHYLSVWHHRFCFRCIHISEVIKSYHSINNAHNAHHNDIKSVKLIEFLSKSEWKALFFLLWIVLCYWNCLFSSRLYLCLHSLFVIIYTVSLYIYNEQCTYKDIYNWCHSNNRTSEIEIYILLIYKQYPRTIKELRERKQSVHCKVSRIRNCYKRKHKHCHTRERISLVHFDSKHIHSENKYKWWDIVFWRTFTFKEHICRICHNNKYHSISNYVWCRSKRRPVLSDSTIDIEGIHSHISILRECFNILINNYGYALYRIISERHKQHKHKSYSRNTAYNYPSKTVLCELVRTDVIYYSVYEHRREE